jgi:predicted SnoaL-like aldol condensation-catalyzing enzyme
MRRRTLIFSAAALGVAPFVRRATAASTSVVERFAATLTAHDLDAFGALFADDYVNHQLSAAAPPPAGVPSKTATVNFFAARLKGLPEVSIQASLADTDKVAASFLYEGTQQGPLYGVAPTGKRLSFTSRDIFRLSDGKIAEHWGMGDIAGVLAQLKG